MHSVTLPKVSLQSDIPGRTLQVLRDALDYYQWSKHHLPSAEISRYDHNYPDQARTISGASVHSYPTSQCQWHILCPVFKRLCTVDLSGCETCHSSSTALTLSPAREEISRHTFFSPGRDQDPHRVPILWQGFGSEMGEGDFMGRLQKDEYQSSVFHLWMFSSNRQSSKYRLSHLCCFPIGKMTSCSPLTWRMPTSRFQSIWSWESICSLFCTRLYQFQVMW